MGVIPSKAVRRLLSIFVVIPPPNKVINELADMQGAQLMTVLAPAITQGPDRPNIFVHDKQGQAAVNRVHIRVERSTIIGMVPNNENKVTTGNIEEQARANMHPTKFVGNIEQAITSAGTINVFQKNPIRIFDIIDGLCITLDNTSNIFVTSGTATEK